MKKYRYLTYSEIPAQVISFVENVSGSKLLDLTITEINNFLCELSDYYDRHNQRIEDFIK